MQLKRRLETLERRAGGTEPLIVFFRTFYDGPQGWVSGETCKAVIIHGPSDCEFIERLDGETVTAFEARSFETAGTTPNQPS